MQNTMVARGKSEDLAKNLKWERKAEENYINNGGKGLKNASFWVINSKNVMVKTT